MKNKRSFALLWTPVAAALLAYGSSAPAQTPVLINAFDTSAEVTDTPWGNWFGEAFYQVLWSASDASNNPASGSLLVETFYPNAGVGGCCGPQFVAYNGNNGINPSLVGNGGPPDSALATNVQFDVRFDPSSFYNTNTGNWPTIEVGTRGTSFGQFTFGTFTLPQTETNWVRVSIPIAASPNWTSIPNVFFKYYSTVDSGSMKLYIDNIQFITASVPIVPPTATIEKASPVLRVFAGSTANTYDREQLTSVDQNQSWVDGTYPVSYSMRFRSFPSAPTNQTALFRYHIFLVPVNNAGGNAFTGNQFIEYQAGDDLWLNITTVNTLSPGSVQAEVAWKTNLPNANPNNIALSITNPTAIGTWTLTFNSATAGTLTAPGASPAPFTIPADAAARFANPLVAFFGVQPDSIWGEGQYVDVTEIHTVGVAAPGVAINDNFTTSIGIDPAIWNVSNSAQTNSLVLVTPDDAFWVRWTYPDYASVLATKADVNPLSAIPWKSTVFYNNSNAVLQARMGNNVWSLVPKAGLPTTDGTMEGVKSPNAFFRTMSPGPAE